MREVDQRQATPDREAVSLLANVGRNDPINDAYHENLSPRVQ
jgi:hypothetical protein